MSNSIPTQINYSLYMKNKLLCFFVTTFLLVSVSCANKSVYSKKNTLKKLEEEGWTIVVHDDLDYCLNNINGAIALSGIDYHIDSIEDVTHANPPKTKDDQQNYVYVSFYTFTKEKDAEIFYQCESSDPNSIGRWFCAYDKNEYVETNSPYVVSIIPLTFSGYSY